MTKSDYEGIQMTTKNSLNIIFLSIRSSSKIRSIADLLEKTLLVCAKLIFIYITIFIEFMFGNMQGNLFFSRVFTLSRFFHTEKNKKKIN